MCPRLSNTTNFSFQGKDVKEIPMVDIAYQILKQSGKAYHYNELVKMIADVKGMTEGQIFDYLPQLYTEVNIDGRFANLGHSEWGLKNWYPADEVDSLYFNRDDDEEEDDIYDYDEDESSTTKAIDDDNSDDADSLYAEDDTNDDIEADADDEEFEDEEEEEIEEDEYEEEED